MPTRRVCWQDVSAQKGFRAHLRLQEQRAIEEHGHASLEEEDEAPPQKRRRGGEVRRDWKCEVEACTKDFKSKKALTIHHAITHLGKRDFVCTVMAVDAHSATSTSYNGIKLVGTATVMLKTTRTLGNMSTWMESPARESGPRPGQRNERPDMPYRMTSIIDEITGVAYAKRFASGQAPLMCPHPSMEGLPSALLAGRQDLWGEAAAPCEYVFGRAYDLRRHLLVVHDISLDKEVVDAWARKERA